MNSGGHSVERARRTASIPLGARSRAGLRILVPGYVQWTWRQNERAAVLFGSFLAALGVGIFTWGTVLGLILLVFAFGAHVVSAADVVRQRAFPGFGRWVPLLSASGGLAIGVYAPTLFLLSSVAWPAMDGGVRRNGYLVNLWAFHKTEPRNGDCVWLHRSPWDKTRVGRVVAKAGQEVEWSGNHLVVDGKEVHSLLAQAPLTSSLDELAFVVPEGHVLMIPEARSQQSGDLEGLILVPQAEVAGRAWVRMYPLWERSTLR